MLPGEEQNHRMIDETLTSIDMASEAYYLIKVKGKLDDRWSDWFNGTIQEIGDTSSKMPHTSLTCRVRDQAELIGIINRLNSLNLPLLEVVIVSHGHQRPDL